MTDENGINDIAKLTPGRYRVGVNVRRGASILGRGFGRPVYFPAGAVDAAIVGVGEGEQVSLGDLVLPSDVTFIQVSGTALTAERIAGRRGERSPASPRIRSTFEIVSGPLVTDDMGRFSLAIPRGERVMLSVEWRHPLPDQPYNSDRGDVPAFVADNDLHDLRIVVSPIKR